MMPVSVANILVCVMMKLDMYQYIGYAVATTGASLLILMWTIITPCTASEPNFYILYNAWG